MKSGKHNSQEVQKREKKNKAIDRNRKRAGKKKAEVAVQVITTTPAPTPEKKAGVFKRLVGIFAKKKH